jgi:NO-binding membrane sensor protein with MHYT domain
MAVGIAAMHYSGIVSMCGPFIVRFPVPEVLATIVVGVSLSAVGLLIIRFAEGLKQKMIGAVVVGGAITFVHYLGMVNITFEKMPDASERCFGEIQSIGGIVDSERLGVVITAIAIVLNFVIQVVWGGGGGAERSGDVLTRRHRL